MKEFASYVRQLQELLTSSKPPGHDRLDLALDGQPATTLRDLVGVETLRESGAFFSGVTLARRLVATISPTLTATSVVVDPTCGSGDLLLAATETFPLQRTVSDTLKRWGQRLAGRDVHREFIAATTVRLALAAVRRGANVDCSATALASMVRDVQVGSCLTDASVFTRATHLVMNPPFAPTQAPKDCRWASGSVNSAAIFMEHAARHANAGTMIASILPDVLRSGSRYAKWRKELESLVRITHVEVIGRFAPEVDVDVFLMVGQADGRQTATSFAWVPEREAAVRVGDLCDVSVGPLVPFRDEEIGPWRAVVAPTDLPRWQTVRSVEARRRFSRRVIDGPFVAIRRTSRPGDGARAVATIIALDRSAAVENHIIVVKPRDATLKTCKRVLASLQRPETTVWLDERIRCRHLTVGAIRSLPIWA